jgi:hypothetical protein
MPWHVCVCVGGAAYEQLLLLLISVDFDKTFYMFDRGGRRIGNCTSRRSKEKYWLKSNCRYFHFILSLFLSFSLF